MKIEDFVKIKETVDLVNVAGGSDTNSTWLFNKIREKIIRCVAVGEKIEDTKKLVKDILSNYEIQTPKVEASAEKIMKEWGFKFE